MSQKSTYLQHCSNGRTILSQIGSTLQRAQNSRNAETAAYTIATEYMKKALGLNQASIDSATPDELNGFYMKALMQSVLQLNAINEVGQDARKERGNDFMKMIHVERAVVRIQAKFRQILTLKKLEKDLENQKARLARRERQKNKTSNEELALKELKQRLHRKGLTPEAFFRTCDPEYKRVVHVDKFRSQLIQFNL